jgi:hypothetical protein
MRQRFADLAGRLDEVDAVIVVLLDAGRDGEDVRVEDDVFRRETRPARSGACRRACRSRPCAPGVGLALFVERHDDDCGAIGAHELARDGGKPPRPSFMEIELTSGLPCTHFRPASITSHFEESIISGTRAMSGSAAMRFRILLTSPSSESIRPSSMLTSMIWAPFSTWSRATSSAAA